MNVIIYWSGTGNTLSIANLIAQDTNSEIFRVGEIDFDNALNYDKIILGCPAMGAEELEDMEFKPFYDELISKVSNQKIFLFGSYDWGDGEWMRIWEEDVKSYGASLGSSGLIVNGDVSQIVPEEYEEFVSKIKE